MNRQRSPRPGWLLGTSLLLAILIIPCDRTEADTSAELSRLALDLVNESRQGEGLPRLSADEALAKAAQAHAGDMASRGYFSHDSPTGHTVLDRYRAAGGSAGKFVAENIAECRHCAAGRGLVSHFHRGWMDSPGHRANILSSGVDRFGFGLAANGDRIVAVQTFAGPGTSIGPAEAKNAPTLDAAAQLAAGLELVNAARRRAGVGPLRASPALADALSRAAGANAMGERGLALPALASILASLPEDQGSRIRKAALLGAQCGGCGIEPNAVDVRFFVEGWLADPQYSSRLLDPRWSELGLLIQADGEGGKRALAILAGP
jgi:uncharacterized protein YkwD